MPIFILVATDNRTRRHRVIRCARTVSSTQISLVDMSIELCERIRTVGNHTIPESWIWDAEQFLFLFTYIVFFFYPFLFLSLGDTNRAQFLQHECQHLSLVPVLHPMHVSYKSWLVEFRTLRGRVLCCATYGHPCFKLVYKWRCKTAKRSTKQHNNTALTSKSGCRIWFRHLAIFAGVMQYSILFQNTSLLAPKIIPGLVLGILYI